MERMDPNSLNFYSLIRVICEIRGLKSYLKKVVRLLLRGMLGLQLR